MRRYGDNPLRSPEAPFETGKVTLDCYVLSVGRCVSRKDAKVRKDAKTHKRKDTLLLRELWVRFDFKQLLRVTLAVSRDEEYPLVSVDLP